MPPTDILMALMARLDHLDDRVWAVRDAAAETRDRLTTLERRSALIPNGEDL